MTLPSDVTQRDRVVTELGDTGRSLLADLERAQAVEATAKAQVEQVKVKLQTLLTQAGATEATVYGQRALTWHPQTSRRMDQGLVRRVLRDTYGWTDEQIDANLYVDSTSQPFRRVS